MVRDIHKKTFTDAFKRILRMHTSEISDQYMTDIK